MYRHLIHSLYKINTRSAVALGLENSSKLHRLLGSPLDGTPVVHVAGTNGKGTVCLKTAEFLRACGLKVGLFVSPHLSSFRERIQINGRNVSERLVVENYRNILELCKVNSIKATFFELATALAFTIFRNEECDFVVLEVGLGGRLDATNVVANPSLSVITSVQLDHTSILGNSLEKIAIEKAGIMKYGTKVLLGPGSAIETLKVEANRRHVEYLTLEDVLRKNEIIQTKKEVDNDLVEGINRCIYKAIVYVLQSEERYIFPLNRIDNYRSEFISNNNYDPILLRPSCRFQIFKQRVKNAREKSVDVILDVAHNVDAIVALREKMRKTYPHAYVRVVVGMCADKDVVNSLPLILSICPLDRIHCVSARHPRALKAHQLMRELYKISHKTVDTCHAADENVRSYNHQNSKWQIQGPRGALRDAINKCGDKMVQDDDLHAIVVVFGTAFIMAECRAELGIIEARDVDTLIKSMYVENKNGKFHADAQENFDSDRR